ncbi:DEAD/DEAH box helicase family protein [Parafilimonas sp.]
MSVTLRDYQANGIKDIMAAWNDCRNVLFQMPTGTGKTTRAKNLWFILP